MKNQILIALAAAAAVLSAGALHAQNTLTWTGWADGSWSNAANWSGSDAPPGASAGDIARFETTSSNAAISLGEEVTIGKLEFLTGADAYTISGGALTISAANNTQLLSHTAANTQTITSNLTLSATGSGGSSRLLYVGADSALTLAGSLNVANGSNINITLNGGGTLNLNGSISNVNNFTATGAGTTINYDNGASGAGTGRPYTFTASNGGQVNLWRTNFSGSLAASGDNASIYAKVAGGMVGSTNSQTLAPSAGGTVTLGADIAGGGTASFSRTTRLNDNAANATIRLDSKADNILAITGSIVDTDTTVAGAGTKVEITGEGVVRFSGTSANTFLTPIAITDGTLELAKSEGVDAIGGGSVGISAAGTLRLAASHQINDVTSLIFAGGTFEVGTFAESLGTLTVGAEGGVIDFSGFAGSLTFDSLSSIAGSLAITGWNENASIVFTDGSAWNDTTLALVNFVGFGAAQFDAITGKLTASAIPEPASAVALFSGVALLGFLVLRLRARHQ